VYLEAVTCVFGGCDVCNWRLKRVYLEAVSCVFGGCDVCIWRL